MLTKYVFWRRYLNVYLAIINVVLTMTRWSEVDNNHSSYNPIVGYASALRVNLLFYQLRRFELQ